MDKKKTMIAAIIGGVALIGGYLWYKNKNKKTATTDTAAGTTATAAAATVVAVNKLVGKYDAAVINQADKANLAKVLNNPSIQGIDYNDPKNTEAANTKYLTDYADLKKTATGGWGDVNSDGTTIGWSHYVMFGKKEGRKWQGDTASFSGENVFS